MLLDGLFCIYALIYKCIIITIVIIEEVKGLNKIQGLGQSSQISCVSPGLVVKHFVLHHLFKNIYVANSIEGQRWCLRPSQEQTTYCTV